MRSLNGTGRPRSAVQAALGDPVSILNCRCCEEEEEDMEVEEGVEPQALPV